MPLPNLVVKFTHIPRHYTDFHPRDRLGVCERQIARHGSHTRDSHRHPGHLSHNFRRSVWPTPSTTKNTYWLATESTVFTSTKCNQGSRSKNDRRQAIFERKEAWPLLVLSEKPHSISMPLRLQVTVWMYINNSLDPLPHRPHGKCHTVPIPRRPTSFNNTTAPHANPGCLTIHLHLPLRRPQCPLFRPSNQTPPSLSLRSHSLPTNQNMPHL
jgi:hypothetical protein